MSLEIQIYHLEVGVACVVAFALNQLPAENLRHDSWPKGVFQSDQDPALANEGPAWAPVWAFPNFMGRFLNFIK